MNKRIILSGLLISISSIFTAACSHVAGNIIPDNGPTMESIYDDSGDHYAAANDGVVRHFTDTSPAVTSRQSTAHSSSALPSSIVSPTFSLLDNPELKLYIFPHLAGVEMLPVPGYWTAFSAYPRNYYALPLTANDSNGEKFHL
jgi:conjugative transfer region lipoprotein (TIGR03751 family)